MKTPDFRTQGLITVAPHLRELRRRVSQAEWDREQNLPQLEVELRHFEKLAEQGVLYEATF